MKTTVGKWDWVVCGAGNRVLDVCASKDAAEDCARRMRRAGWLGVIVKAEPVGTVVYRGYCRDSADWSL